MSYSPRPGSTGERVLQQLRAHGPMNEKRLALALDMTEHDLAENLKYPIRMGGVEREVDGDLYVYSLGRGMPGADEAPQTPKPETWKAPANGHGDEAEDTPPRGLTAMQARGEVMEPEGCASPTDRGSNAAPARAAGPVSIPETAGLIGKNAALWLTGEIAVEAENGTVIVLSSAMASRLASMLARLRGAAA